MSTSTPRRVTRLARWNSENQATVDALLSELRDETARAAGASARQRAARLKELAQDVKALRDLVFPLLSRLSTARLMVAQEGAEDRALVLAALTKRVRYIRRETRVLLDEFKRATRELANESFADRAARLEAVVGSVRSLRTDVRRFMNQVRVRHDEASQGFRAERRSFIDALRDADAARVDAKFHSAGSTLEPTSTQKPVIRAVKAKPRAVPRIEPVAKAPDPAPKKAAPVQPRIAPKTPALPASRMLQNSDGMSGRNGSKLVRNILNLTRERQRGAA